MSGKKGISLYFHIPFCRRKCPYCHFYVLPDKEEYKVELLRSLELEWKWRLPQLVDCEITSIYFGGGTPSLFGPKAIGTVLNWIRSSVKLSPACEITIEANPEDGEKLAAFAEVGINRLSLGLQSLHSPTLLLLGRNHAKEDALSALSSAKRAGITNLSVDLMYDTPEQTVSSLEATLRELRDLPITHLSLYNLTIEPETIFFKKRAQLVPLLPSQDESLKLLQTAVAHLEEMGLKRYEISAFAREGQASVHNVGYWTARPFLGFGPSAFSYWEGKRFRNIAHLRKYSQFLQQGSSPVDFEEKLTYPDNLLELLAVELRLLRGVSLSEFQTRHAPLPPDALARLSELMAKGWLSQQGDRIHLTEEGILFYDSVASEIL